MLFRSVRCVLRINHASGAVNKTKLQPANYLDYLDRVRAILSHYADIPTSSGKESCFIPEITLAGFHRDAIFGRYYIPSHQLLWAARENDTETTRREPHLL